MKLGEQLVTNKLLSAADLALALQEQQRSGEFLGSILLRRRLLSEEDLLRNLAEQFGMGFVKLKNTVIDWAVATRFSSKLVVDHKCLPFTEDDLAITVAVSNPLDVEAVRLAEDEAGNRRVRVVLAQTKEIEDMVRQYKERMAEKIRKLLG